MSDTTTATATAPNGAATAPPSSPQPNSPPPVHGVPALRLNVEIGDRGLQPRSLDELWRVAMLVHNSELAPSSFKTAEQVCVALAYAIEVGMSLFSALQCLAVINGKVAMYGDSMLARVRASVVCRDYDEWYEDNDGRIEEGAPGWRARLQKALRDETVVAMSRLVRQDRSPIVRYFSVDDAKVAGLWGKRGRNGEPTPWITYPLRMLRWRARSWTLRDGASDVLGNMMSVEEAADIADAEYEIIAPTRPPVTRVTIDPNTVRPKADGAGADALAPSGAHAAAQSQPDVATPKKGEDGDWGAAKPDPRRDEPAPNELLGRLAKMFGAESWSIDDCQAAFRLYGAAKPKELKRWQAEELLNQVTTGELRARVDAAKSGGAA